jgi:myo-inositol 2-dehydrogenase / D-chiro-inositol 1-dehydrogenase
MDHLTRRDAMKAALAAPALLGAQSPHDTVRVAVIGVGTRGSYLLRHTLEIPGVKVVALCDLDESRLARAKQAAGDAATDTDFRRLIDNSKDIDAIIIATPVDTHKMIALAALEAGKNVYCEKPMSNTPEDVRVMVLAARSAKGIFQSGFQLRHDPARRAAMEFVHGGGLGRVLFLQGYRHGGDLPRETPWYFDRSRSGDNIVEQACHIIDLMVWAVDKPPLRAFGSGGISLFKDEPPGRTTMDNYAVIYEFPDDIRFEFSHLYFDPPGFSGIKERVFCANGAIDLQTATWMDRLKRGANKLAIPDAGQSADYQSLAAFIENARGHKTPLNNAESAARSTLVAMMGRKAIYEKRIVTWQEMQA